MLKRVAGKSGALLLRQCSSLQLRNYANPAGVLAKSVRQQPEIAPITVLRGRIYKCCSSFSNTVPVVDYSVVKDLPDHPEKMLIDVREPDEIKETGQIPTSINIPLGKVLEELGPQSSVASFKEKYGREKPDVATELIFHCRKGQRSLKAAKGAISLGYRNVKNYEGSWTDWADRQCLSQ